MTETQTTNPYPAAPATGGGAWLGAASLVIGLVLVAIGVVQQFVNLLIPSLMFDSGLAASQVGLMFGAIAIVTGVIAAVGVVTGLLGIRSTQPRGRLAAAAGLALGGAHLVGAIVAFVAPLTVGALL